MQDANCGNTLLISLEELVKDGLLMKDELPEKMWAFQLLDMSSKSACDFKKMFLYRILQFFAVNAREMEHVEFATVADVKDPLIAKVSWWFWTAVLSFLLLWRSGSSIGNLLTDLQGITGFVWLSLMHGFNTHVAFIIMISL